MVNKNATKVVEHVLVIFVFILGMKKIIMLQQQGLTPFREYLDMLGVPAIAVLYVPLSLVIEMGFAFGVWFRSTMLVTTLMMTGLVLIGVFLSFYSLYLKTNSDCGCGLLGQNEYAYLAQKLLLLIALVYLLKNRSLLFKAQQ